MIYAIIKLSLKLSTINQLICQSIKLSTNQSNNLSIYQSTAIRIGVDPQSDAIRQAVESLTANNESQKNDQDKDDDKKDKK